MGISVEIIWDSGRGNFWSIKIYKDGVLIRYDRLGSGLLEIDDTDPDLTDEELIEAARQQQSWYGIEFSRNVITIIRNF
jgi:hypothetical protein